MSEILIYDYIGEGDSTVGVVKRALTAANGGEVVVRINSPGGNAFDGLAIHNVLREHAGRVVVKVDGMALSAASVIAMAGDEIRMAANAMMMIHNPSAVVVGGPENMRGTADRLDKLRSSVADVYVARCGKSSDEVLAMMAAETWMTAVEALSAGFATHVDAAQKVAAVLTAEHLAAYRHAPPIVRQWMRSDASAHQHAGRAGTQVPAQGNPPRRNPMSEKLFKLLGAADEGEALVIAHEINTLSRALLESTGTKTLDDALAVVKANAALPSEVKRLSDAHTALQVRETERERDGLIATLTKDGKLAPCQHGWAKALPLQLLKDYGQSAPVIDAVSTPAGQAPATQAITLSDEDKRVATMMGVSLEDFEAERRDELKRGNPRVLTLSARRAKE